MQKGWSFEYSNWSSLPDILINKKWKTAKFTDGEAAIISKSEGVYMFVTNLPVKADNILNNLRAPIYIGLSNNLQRRFKEHLGMKGPGHPDLLRARSCFKNKLDFYYIETVDFELKDLEQKLFNCFGPVVNKNNSINQDKPVKAKVGTEEKL